MYAPQALGRHLPLFLLLILCSRTPPSAAISQKYIHLYGPNELDENTVPFGNSNSRRGRKYEFTKSSITLELSPRSGFNPDERGVEGYTILKVTLSASENKAKAVRALIYDATANAYAGDGSLPDPGTKARWFIAHHGVYKFRIFAPLHNIGLGRPDDCVSMSNVYRVDHNPEPGDTDPQNYFGSNKGIWCNKQPEEQDEFSFDTKSGWSLPAQGVEGPNANCSCLSGDTDSLFLQVNIMCATEVCDLYGVTFNFELMEEEFHWCYAGHTMTSRGQCEPCNPGYFASENGTVGSCKACPPGQFAASKLACVDCPLGYAAAEDASVECRKCSAGEFANATGSSACTECAPGRYLPPNSDSGHDESDDCSECPATTFQYSSGSKECIPCSGAITPGSSVCPPSPGVCGVGRFAKNSSTGCEDCAPGTYSNTENQISCKRCPAGFHGMEAQSPAIGCVGCMPGTRMDTNVVGARNSSDCGNCPQGWYQDLAGSTSCTACPEGKYGSEYAIAHESGCQSCPPGRYGKTTAKTTEEAACYACGAGKFSVVAGAIIEDECKDCPAGYVQAEEAHVYCLPCAGGRRQHQKGKRECVACEKGKFADGVANSNETCNVCPLGFYTPAKGLSKCLDCPSGQFGQSVLGECSDCPKGWYRAKNDILEGDDLTAALVRCVYCPAGYAAPTDGEPECQRCERGSYADNNRSACTECPKGWYGPDADVPSCTSCPRGYAAEATALTNCDRCIPGTYAAGTASEACAQCDGDSYVDKDAATACTKCDAGKGSRGSGGKMCVALPTDTTKPSPHNVSFAVQWEGDAAGLILRVAWDFDHNGTDLLDGGDPCDLLYYNLFYTVREGARCASASNVTAARPGGCCDRPMGGELVTRHVKLYNPRCLNSSSLPSLGEAAHNDQAFVAVNAGGAWIDRGFVRILMPEPAWCYGLQDPSGVEVVYQQFKSAYVPLTWTTAADCADTYLNRTRLANPFTWRCAASCPRGASCNGVLTWPDVRPLFGWFRLQQGQAARGKAAPGREREPNNFTACRFPPACLGARNDALAGLFDMCVDESVQENQYSQTVPVDTGNGTLRSSVSSAPAVAVAPATATKQCDPSQVDWLEECNEVAGFLRTCADGEICRLCARCRAGFQRSAQGVGFKCELCPAREENKWRMIAGGLFAFILVLVLVKLGMSDVLEGNPSDAMNRILLNFLQVLSIFAAFPLQWPAPLLEMFKISQAVSVLGESLVNPDCELSWNPSHLFFAKMMVWAVLPLGVVALCYVYWRCFGIATAVPFKKQAAAQLGLKDASADGGGLELTSSGISSAPDTVPHVVGVAGSATKAAPEGAAPYTTEDATTSRPSALIASSAARFRADILKKLKARRPTPKDHFMVSTVILLYLCYPSICRNSFRILSCIVVGQDFAGGEPTNRLFLAADPEEPCFEGQHLVVVLAVGLPQLFVYVLGMPLVALAVLFRNRHRLENARTKYRWGILYVGLRPDRFYWDIGPVALRKSAVFSLSVIGSSDEGLALQTHLAMLVLMLSLLAHLVGRPYQPEWYLLDVFEVSGLVVCWLLMWSGICFYTDSVTAAQRELVTVCLMLVNSVFSMFVGAVLVRQKIMEQAPWTLFVRRMLCCCVSDARLRMVGAWVPVIDPASRYRAEAVAQLGERVKSGRDDTVWTQNPNANTPAAVAAAAAAALAAEALPAAAPTETSPGTLPRGWIQDVDPTTGRAFYYTMQGQSQWEYPLMPAPAE